MQQSNVINCQPCLINDQKQSLVQWTFQVINFLKKVNLLVPPWAIWGSIYLSCYSLLVSLTHHEIERSLVLFSVFKEDAFCMVWSHHQPWYACITTTSTIFWCFDLHPSVKRMKCEEMSTTSLVCLRYSHSLGLLVWGWVCVKICSALVFLLPRRNCGRAIFGHGGN